MAYDAMGNYIGYEDYSTPVAPVMPSGEETEEERRKREEEERKRREKEAKRADETAVQEQKVITYENGSKTVETKQEIPAGGKVQPVAPSYNQRIAREESGNKPNIGFHDKNKSSAYGTYGMTSAGYEDARRRDPSLPEDITQASPEQQTQAQNAFTQQNAGYLKNYGIEPTENNLAAAHFLGAKGLRDYLETGRVSDAAARANGGADNVKRIVDQRLSGQAAPASGAAQQRPQQRVQPVAPTFARPQAEPGPGVAVATGQGVQGTTTTPISPEQAQVQAQQQVSRDVVNPDEAVMAQDKAQNFLQTQTAAIGRYTEAQNDPAALMKMGTDENVPEMLRDRARNRAADLITQQREQARAQEDLAKKNPSELARLMTERKKDGSWGKYILFGALGMTALRDEEAQKLGIGTDKIVTDAEGKSYLVKVGANGAPIEGFDSEGKALTPEKMIQAMGAGQAMKGVNQGQEVYKDPSGVVKGSFVLETRPGRQPIYKEVGTGRIATADESAVLSKIGVAGTLDQQRAQQVQKQNIDLAGDWAKLQMKIEGAAPEAANKFMGEFNAKHGTNFGLQSITGSAPQISADTGRITQAAPTQAQAAPAAPTQAAPQAGRVQPVVPGSPEAQRAPAAPATGATTAAPAGQFPADIESARKRKEAEETSQREIEETVAKEAGKKITEMRIALPKTERAANVTIATVDDLLKHPGFSDVIGMPNILTGIISAPTTNARDFKQKYEQVKGKAFMAAYDSMRGTGSITDAEGKRAETAIAALSDPYISEKEFKRNAEIFKSTLRNGIDNERMQVGQEPRYKKFSADEKEAFQWLQKNPKDPRADAVRLKLERSGD